MATANLTADRARGSLNYDPNLGVLTWRLRPVSDFKSLRAANAWNTKYAGRRAGSTHSTGYRYICIDGRSQLEHRVVWLLVHGEWPANEIDHINGDKSDNALSNLRDVSGHTNAQNLKRAPLKASSLPLGVFFNARKVARPYSANIRLRGRKKHLGYFDTAQEAHAAYLVAKRAFHDGCTI